MQAQPTSGRPIIGRFFARMYAIPMGLTTLGVRWGDYVGRRLFRSYKEVQWHNIQWNSSKNHSRYPQRSQIALASTYPNYHAHQTHMNHVPGAYYGKGNIYQKVSTYKGRPHFNLDKNKFYTTRTFGHLPITWKHTYWFKVQSSFFKKLYFIIPIYVLWIIHYSFER